MSKVLARANRRRLTDAEMRLWFRLRPLRQQGLAFRRQSPLGGYVADFECRRARLVVEVDGGQHDMSKAQAYDKTRTAWLESEGYRVLRYSNQNVLRQTDIVMDEILLVARQRAAETPVLSRQGEVARAERASEG